jgi:hypothetical protein
MERQKIDKTTDTGHSQGPLLATTKNVSDESGDRRWPSKLLNNAQAPDVAQNWMRRTALYQPILDW